MNTKISALRWLLLLAVIAIPVSALANGAYAGSKPAPKWPVSAYSHPLRRAHSASVAATIPLPDLSDASLAAVSGTNEVYIGHRYSPTTLDCHWERIHPQGGAGGCARASEVESKGVVSLYEPSEGAPAHVLAFVPDGVGSVVVTDSDGSSHTLTVTNNLAMYEDANGAAIVSYRLPSGANRSVNVAAFRSSASSKP